MCVFVCVCGGGGGGEGGGAGARGQHRFVSILPSLKFSI